MTEIQLVRDLMTIGVPSCTPDTPITEIARLILERDLEAVVVIDHEGHAVGVVSQDELVRAYAQPEARNLTAEAVMREGVLDIPAEIPLAAAAQIMQDQGVRIVFVLHHSEGISYPAAMLSYKYLLRHLAAADHAELSDLGVKASRQAPLDAFLKRRDEARRRTLSQPKE